MKEAILETCAATSCRMRHPAHRYPRHGAMGVDPGSDLTPTVIVFAHPWAPSWARKASV